MSKIATPSRPQSSVREVFEFRNQVDMTQTNTDVLPRVATGDAAAVSECLNRYGNIVWALAKRSIRDLQAAEDAVQEIFLKLWEVADRFDASIASETTFVAMIARRKLIDINRRRKLPTAAAPEFDAFESNEVDAARQLELSDEASKAADLLTQLPTEQQKVIKLSIYDGLSHSRIAESTGLSLGTVKTHIRRGFIKLRRLLFAKPDYYENDEFGSTEKEEN